MASTLILVMKVKFRYYEKPRTTRVKELFLELLGSSHHQRKILSYCILFGITVPVTGKWGYWPSIAGEKMKVFSAFSIIAREQFIKFPTGFRSTSIFLSQLFPFFDFTRSNRMPSLTHFIFAWSDLANFLSGYLHLSRISWVILGVKD